MNNNGTSESTANMAERAERRPEQPEVNKIAGQFQTIAELFGDGYEPNSWLVNRLLPSESIVSLQGQAKCGKSTFILHMVKELIGGGEFLGQKLEKTRVVYVTEQNRKSFLCQLRSAGIDPESDGLTVLTVERTLGFGNWEELFQACEKQVSNTGSKLLVIDSWGRFVGITEQEENKAAPVQERITELRKLITNTGATVLILHHVRKSGGNIIDAGMSSSALAQQVDVLLSLSGQPTQEDVPPGRVKGPAYRLVQSKSRFPDVINNEQVKWERDDRRYVLEGGPARGISLLERLWELLPANPYEAVNAAELAKKYSEAAGKDISQRTVENLIPDLKEGPSVQQLDGTGVKGKPAKLWKLPAQGAGE